MKTKRILSLLLASCLIVTLLASCGENKGNTSGSSTTADAGSAATESEDDGIFNLGSNVFGDTTSTTTEAPTASGNTSTSTGSKPGATLPSSTPPVVYEQVDEADISKLPKYVQETYKKLPKLQTDKEKKLTIMYHEKMAESQTLGYKYGVTMETTIVPWSELITRYVAAVNADKGPDIVIDDYNFTMISKGYVQAWDKYVNLSDPMWKSEKELMSNFVVGGKNYLFIPKDPRTGGKVTYVLYNAEMIKDAGLKTPSELFAENKWDWDAFINIADKLTDDKAKTYGAWLYNGPQMMVNTTGHDFVDFVNGKAKNMVKSAEVTRAIKAYSDLIANKSVYFGSNAEVMVQRGTVAMAVTTIGGVKVCLNEIEKGTCGFTALPRDPSLKDHYMPYMANGFYLAKGAKHPYNAVAYMTTWHYEHEREFLRAQNDEALAKGEGKGTPKIIYDTADEIDNKVKGVMHTWTMFPGDLAVWVSAIGGSLNAGEPWSKIAAEMSPVVDASIKGFYGG